VVMSTLISTVAYFLDSADVLSTGIIYNATETKMSTRFRTSSAGVNVKKCSTLRIANPRSPPAWNG
jgi:hypothetical protein